MVVRNRGRVNYPTTFLSFFIPVVYEVDGLARSQPYAARRNQLALRHKWGRFGRRSDHRRRCEVSARGGVWSLPQAIAATASATARAMVFIRIISSKSFRSVEVPLLANAALLRIAARRLQRPRPLRANDGGRTLARLVRLAVPRPAQRCAGRDGRLLRTPR